MEDRKFIAIGPRTGKNILKGRNIRKNEMGGDVFEDYWTDSEDETFSNSTKSACKLSEVDTNRDSSKVACEEQQLTVCFDESPIEEASINIEASNSNKMHLEGPVPVSEIPIRSTSPLQNEIAKSHPCNSRKSSINPKYAAKLKHYDELDMQIMQMFNEVDQMSESETNSEKPVSEDSEHITKEIHPLDKCNNNGENEDDGISEGCCIYNLSPKAHKERKVAVNKKNVVDENPPFSDSAEQVQDKIISQEIGKAAEESQSEDGNDLGLVDKNEAIFNSGEKEGSEIDEREKEVAMRNNSFEELFISQSVHENSNSEEGVKSDFMKETSASPIECSSKDGDHCVNQTYEVQNPLTPKTHKKRRRTVKSKSENDQIPPLNIEAKNNNQNVVSEKKTDRTGVKEKDSSDKCSSSDESGDDSVSQTQKAHLVNSLNLKAHKKGKRTVNNKNECDHPLRAEDHLENLSLNTSVNVSQGRQSFNKSQAVLNSVKMVESETAGKKQRKVVEDSHMPDFSPHGPSNVNEEPHNDYSSKDESGGDNINQTYDSHNSPSAKLQKKKKRAVKNMKESDKIHPLGAEDQLEVLSDLEMDCILSNVRSSKHVFDRTQALLNSEENVEPEIGNKNKNIIVRRKSSVLHNSAIRNKNITYQKENIESSAIQGMDSSDECSGDDDVNQAYNVRNSSTAKSHKRRKRIVNNKRKRGRIHSLNAKDALGDLHDSPRRKRGLTFSNGFPDEQLIDKTQAVLSSIEKIGPTIETENKKNSSNSSVPRISPNIDKSLTYGKENNKSDSVEEIDSSSNERGSESENEDGGVHQTNDFHNSKTSKRGKGKKKTVNKRNKSSQIGSLSAEVVMKNMHVSVSEDTLSRKKKKIKNQKRKISNIAEDIRRSRRQRFPPLARWRNERLIYTLGDDGLYTVTGIDEGNKEDDAPIQYLYRRQELQKQQQKKKIESRKQPKKAKLIHTVENKTVTADLVKGFSVIPWQTLNEDAQGVPQPYYIKKMIETDNSAFGFIQISVGQEKPHQYMPNDDLQVTLIKGEVEVFIQKNRYSLNVHDMFMVPKDCAYCIKNIGNTKALLTFAVGKFDFI